MIKKAYNYIFYKLYRMFEAAPTVWWSEYKAVATISILWVFTILSLVAYYIAFINQELNLDSFRNLFIIVMLTIYGCNHYIFLYSDNWKIIIEEFDKLSQKQNKKGSWFVCLFVLIIITNVCFSFYLISSLDS